MKKKILVLTFMFICSLLFVDNVKAEVLVCKYCNNNNCYYVAHNTEAPKITDENVEFAVNEDEERQRIFNSIGKEIELKWSEGWLETDSQWTLPYIEDPTKCSKYLYYVQYKQTYGLNLYSSAEKTTDGFIETDKTVTKENSMDYIKDFLVFQFGTHDGHVNKFVVNELVYQESLPDVYIKYKTLKNNILEIMENTKDKNSNVQVMSDVGCKILTDPMKEKLNWFFNILKYGGAALAILLGAIDFFKAVMSDEDNATKKASQRFIKRIIAAALIFLIPLFIQFIMNNIEIPGFNVNAPTCGIGVSESNEVSLETNNVEYVEEGVKVEPTYSNAPNTSDTYTESSSDTASFEMKMGPLMDIEKMRGLLITSALSAVSATENYIYLKPSSNERDAAKITKLANVTGEISGGDCLKKMYNNERCVTIDGKSYYGADCNSFVSSIYHKILGFSNDTSMRFFYPSGSKWYLDGDNDGKYFDTTYYGSSLDKLLANAEPGDAIARSCANNSTHIGMYYRKVNNTHYVIDNGGWTGAKQRFNPIRTATIDEFIGVATNCKYTLFKLREDV